MLLFTPVIEKYTKKILDLTKPHYSKQILPVPSLCYNEVPLYLFVPAKAGGWWMVDRSNKIISKDISSCVFRYL